MIEDRVSNFRFNTLVDRAKSSRSPSTAELLSGDLEGEGGMSEAGFAVGSCSSPDSSVNLTRDDRRRMAPAPAPCSLDLCAPNSLAEAPLPEDFLETRRGNEVYESSDVEDEEAVGQALRDL
jgi:hypothetical protein